MSRCDDILNRPHDLRIDTPTRIHIVGPSQSGKTHFLCKLIKYAEHMFKDVDVDENENEEEFLSPRCFKPERILFFYKQENKIYHTISNLVDNWVQSQPDIDYIYQFANQFKNDGGCVIIIDDYGDDLTSNILELYTVGSHHLNITLICLFQSFHPTAARLNFIRECIQNTQHTILFQNHQRKSQFRHFAYQVYPTNPKFFLDSLENAFSLGPYSYMWYDASPKRDHCLRLRTNVFPNELDDYNFAFKVFIPTDKKKK